MRDYITTIFNLIVGLINADKIIYLALIGLGLLVVFQLISLLANFHRRFANRCRKISKFLTTNGLSANNYNQFLALVAKMPQEFIRGYKTFEHASYGLPSDYIKRFDSLDVEVNGGLLNHGKSLFKAMIYGWTIILALLSLALLGSETALTGYAVADAMIIPVLFLILAKIVYFIFNAIKQQQYKTAVDEFNEMLDIMDDKIENNDNLPGPDILADVLHAELPEEMKILPVANNEVQEEIIEPVKAEVAPIIEEVDEMPSSAESVDDIFTEEELIDEVEPQYVVDNMEVPEETINDASGEQALKASEPEVELNNNTSSIENEDVADVNVDEDSDKNEIVAETDKQEKQKIENKPKTRKPRKKAVETENKGEVMEEKRGRGRPKKIAEGELVITNDKQFEEVLQRAEKLMRKSEEALSGSQAKRVEKSLKELIDAMQKYKEEH